MHINKPVESQSKSQEISPLEKNFEFHPAKREKFFNFRTLNYWLIAMHAVLKADHRSMRAANLRIAN